MSSARSPRASRRRSSSRAASTPPRAIRLAFAAGATRSSRRSPSPTTPGSLRACLEVAGDWLAVGLDARADRLAAFRWHRRHPTDAGRAAVGARRPGRPAVRAGPRNGRGRKRRRSRRWPARRRGPARRGRGDRPRRRPPRARLGRSGHHPRRGAPVRGDRLPVRPERPPHELPPSRSPRPARPRRAGHDPPVPPGISTRSTGSTWVDETPGASETPAEAAARRTRAQNRAAKRARERRPAQGGPRRAGPGPAGIEAPLLALAVAAVAVGVAVILLGNPFGTPGASASPVRQPTQSGYGDGPARRASPMRSASARAAS